MKRLLSMIFMLIVTVSGIIVMQTSKHDIIQEFQKYQMNYIQAMCQTGYDDVCENFYDNFGKDGAVHVPQIYPKLKMEPPYSPAPSLTPPLTGQSGPFKVGDEHYFRMSVNLNNMDFRAVKSKLAVSAKHGNIWIADDADFHKATGSACNSYCKLKSVTEKMMQDMAAEFDGIYERMCDPQKGFAEHANKLFDLNYTTWKKAGDWGNDGKVNVLLYDIDVLTDQSATSYIAGFFYSGDMFEAENIKGANGNVSVTPIDVIHMDVGGGSSGSIHGFGVLQSEDKSVFYGTLAHEFQHLLFSMYFGAYLENTESYLWFNEALSGLADIYYKQSGKEMLANQRFWNAAPNNYKYGDLFNFGGTNKSYSMGYLYAMMLYKDTNGTFAKNIYDYFRNDSVFGYTFMQRANFFRDKANTYEKVIGNGFKYIFDSKYAQLNDTEAFADVYFKFMETFAADGGTVHSKNGTSWQTSHFRGETTNFFNLWKIRETINENGTGKLYAKDGDTSYMILSESSYPRIPTLKSGGAVTLKGYNGDIQNGPSHEMLYRIPIGSGGNFLNITIPDSAKNSGTRFYVAIPTTNAERADIYEITPGTKRSVDTFGRDSYLFVATIYNNVNTTVEFSFSKENISSIAPMKQALGDFNGDGVINAIDASDILTIYSLVSTGVRGGPTLEELVGGDVNGDGIIDALDASGILDYYSYVQTTKTVPLLDIGKYLMG